jgi:hypothetical protein
MSYTVHSKMFPKWRGVVWVFGPVAYLGLLLAPSVVFGIPFQLFHRHGAPVGYWLTAAVVLWVIYRLARFSYCSFRQRVVDLEALVGCVGCVVALAVATWIFPPG